MVQLSRTPSSTPGPRPAAGDPVSTLAQRIGESGAGPLVTWYRGPDRVELSARTVGTWVAKTVHLMSEEGVGRGDLVHLQVLSSHPLHWVSCCWLLATWWSGATPSVLPTDSSRAALAVAGPDATGCDPRVPLVQCSLEPLAGPCQDPVPGAIDYCEALAMPDEMPGATPAPLAQTWLADVDPMNGRSLAGVPPVAGPLLVATGDPGATPAHLAVLLAGCLRGGGSLVLVESTGSGTTIEQIARQERASRDGLTR